MTKEQHAEGLKQLARMRITLARVLDDGFRRTKRAGDFISRQRRRIAAVSQLDESLRKWATSSAGSAELAA